MYKYGFIGMGNMGKAILKGLSERGLCRDVVFSSGDPEKMKSIAEKTGIKAADGKAGSERNRNVASMADIIILAVKPQVLPSVCEDIREALTAEKTVVSLAAGIRLEKLYELLGDKAVTVRAMPNTPAAVGEGMSALCFGKAELTGEKKKEIREIFEACGDTAEVSEPLLDVMGVTAGSSPAFTYMYIDALADAGVKYGIKREESVRIAAKAVLGAAAMVLRTGEHPEALKNKVCSPGGTTIEGVEALYETGFKNSVMKACTACMDKNDRLSGK